MLVPRCLPWLSLAGLLQAADPVTLTNPTLKDWSLVSTDYDRPLTVTRTLKTGAVETAFHTTPDWELRRHILALREPVGSFKLRQTYNFRIDLPPGSRVRLEFHGTLSGKAEFFLVDHLGRRETGKVAVGYQEESVLIYTVRPSGPGVSEAKLKLLPSPSGSVLEREDPQALDSYRFKDASWGNQRKTVPYKSLPPLSEYALIRWESEKTCAAFPPSPQTFKNEFGSLAP